jgi:ubiquinone/menaquinone biosynthesis C-methylase UbiE
MSLSPRKTEILAHSERYAQSRAEWREKSQGLHREDNIYLRFLIPAGARVLEIGCGIGDTLAALKPSRGVGIDFSPAMIAQASARHPHLAFVVADAEDPAALAALEGPFDYILVMDTIGSLEDCQAFFASLHKLCTRETRLIVG